MHRKVYISLILLLTSAIVSVAQDRSRNTNLNALDTLSNTPIEIADGDFSDSAHMAGRDRATRFYNRLDSISMNRKFPRLLYKMMIVNRLDTAMTGRIVDEARLLQPLEGLTIGEITLDRKPVFENGKSWVQRASNKIHRLTRQRTIRRDLLFKSGDKFDPAVIVRTSQLIKSRSYIYDINMEYSINPEDSTVVDINIVTRDSWTIGGNLDFYRGKHTTLGLYDANFLGLGDRLTVNTNFGYDLKQYGGNVVEYRTENLFGTFYTGVVKVGKNFDDSVIEFELRKDFMLPTDYEVGIAVRYNTEAEFHTIMPDTLYYKLIKYRNLHAWGGKSVFLDGINSSIFFTGGFEHKKFFKRPEVTPTLNPLFHDFDEGLLGFGFYNEKFYSATMIYGYGYKEYLGAGYKVEAVSGYNWNEFDNHVYMGVKARRGGFATTGYLMGEIGLGSYYSPQNRRWWQSTLDAEIHWFSPLLIMKRSRLRQFITFNYTHGWNRGEGANELLRFTNNNKLTGLQTWVVGRNRAILNAENVLFTPLQPIGFRIAVFTFADLALMGNHNNPFHNPFYTTLGFGVRLKNERLIFNTIQLRFGIALGKHGFMNNNWYRLSTEQRVNRYRFVPSRPEVVAYE